MSTAGVTRRNFVQGVGAAGLATAGHTEAAQSDQPLYKQASAGVESRVNDLLSRMTLEEKVAQMMCIWIGKNRVQDERGDFDAARAAAAAGDGWCVATDVAEALVRDGLPFREAHDRVAGRVAAGERFAEPTPEAAVSHAKGTVMFWTPASLSSCH